MTAAPDDRETALADEIVKQTYDVGYVELANTIAAALRAAREDGRRQGATEMREAAGYLHEQINPASDEERQNSDPGAGAMGAVIEYRDKIRALPLLGDAPAPAQEETT